jgi:hypothetical protein
MLQRRPRSLPGCMRPRPAQPRAGIAAHLQPAAHAGLLQRLALRRRLQHLVLLPAALGEHPALAAAAGNQQHLGLAGISAVAVDADRDAPAHRVRPTRQRSSWRSAGSAAVAGGAGSQGAAADMRWRQGGARRGAACAAARSWLRVDVPIRRGAGQRPCSPSHQPLSLGPVALQGAALPALLGDGAAHRTEGHAARWQGLWQGPGPGRRVVDAQHHVRGSGRTRQPCVVCGPHVAAPHHGPHNLRRRQFATRLASMPPAGRREGATAVAGCLAAAVGCACIALVRQRGEGGGAAGGNGFGRTGIRRAGSISNRLESQCDVLAVPRTGPEQPLHAPNPQRPQPGRCCSSQPP